MSLFSTIAHPSAPRSRGLSLKVVALVAVGLILGTLVGVTVLTDSPTIETTRGAQATLTGSANEEFFRVNVTDLERLSPSLPSAVAAPADVDPFIYWNTTALDALVAKDATDTSADRARERFWDWNVTSLEYAGVAYLEPKHGPR